MIIETFLQVVHAVCAAGYSGDIEWSEDAGPPADPEEFAEEAIFVICNSGMKNTIARRIYDRVIAALHAGRPVGPEDFGHKLKVRAINRIWTDRIELFFDYHRISADADRIEWLGQLPHIGGITKFHLAKNFGVDVAKPDVHLQRLADHYGETVQGLCDRLAAESRYKSRTVDVLLWRACAIGLIDSRSGAVRLPS